MRHRIGDRYSLLLVARSVGFVSSVYTLFPLRDLSFTQVGVLSALASFLGVGRARP